MIFWIALGALALLAYGVERYVDRGPAIASPGLSPGPSKTPYDEIFDRVGHERGIDPDLLRAIGEKESSFDSAALGEAGEIGVMQILPKTGAHYGYSQDDLFDPENNITCAARLLADLKHELGSIYSLDTWISSYNEGSPNVLQRGILNADYVAKVKSYYSAFSGREIV